MGINPPHQAGSATVRLKMISGKVKEIKVFSKQMLGAVHHCQCVLPLHFLALIELAGKCKCLIYLRTRSYLFRTIDPELHAGTAS